MDVESAVTDAAVDLEMSNFEAIDDIEQRTLALRLKTKDAFKGLRNSLMEKITPGRYLLLTDSSFHQRADAEDEKSDEAEEAPEDDEFQGDFVTPFRAEHGFDLAPHERFVFVDGEQISIWEYLGNEWSALIVSN